MSSQDIYDFKKQLEGINENLGAILIVLVELNKSNEPWYIKLYKYVKGVL